MVRNGGHWNSQKTHCKRGHELTPDNCYENRAGRKCKTCARDRAAAQYAGLKSSDDKHPATPFE